MCKYHQEPNTRSKLKGLKSPSQLMLRRAAVDARMRVAYYINERVSGVNNSARLRFSRCVLQFARQKMSVALGLALAALMLQILLRTLQAREVSAWAMTIRWIGLLDSWKLALKTKCTVF